MATCEMCVQCGANLPLVGKTHSGNYSKCCSLECRKARKRVTYQRWWDANKSREWAKRSERIKAWREKHPEYFKAYYAHNKDRRKVESQAWYQANADYANRRQKKYTENRPIEQRRAQGRKSANKRRAIKKQVFVEVVDPTVVFERDQGICGICKGDVERASTWEIDHIVPISKGGAHAYANVQLAHRRCNRSKGAHGHSHGGEGGDVLRSAGQAG